MRSIAIVGTGIMGSGIAHNFLKQGYAVFVWNRTREHADTLVQEGAIFAETPAEAAQNADIVFEVTANDETSKSVWYGDEGILTGARKEAILVTNATLSVPWVMELASTCIDRKLSFFDMPMTGGRVGAETGKLTLLVGGEQDVLDAIMPYLEVISQKVVRFGSVGSGMKFKLLLNMLQAIHINGFAEVLRIAKSCDLDLDATGNFLVERPGGIPTSLAWQGYQGDPDPINFAVQWIYKDLKYAKKLAEEFSTPLLDATIQKYGDVIQDGLKEKDWTVITKF